jgi:Ca2+-binding EF-hand superfamily protein
MSENDVDVLFSVADIDNDGKININDFRSILENNPLNSSHKESIENNADVITLKTL